MARIENVIDPNNGSTTADICKSCCRKHKHKDEVLIEQTEDVMDFIGDAEYTCEICDIVLTERNF